MQRYHAANCTSAVNNSAIGGASARDSGRADSSSIGNYSLNSRRPPPLTPYKLKCEKDGLNSRLGPPDFHPPTSSSPEENLTKEYVQYGYKETVDGLKESEEIILSQVDTFSKPVVLKCKEAVRKCLRAINESRALKRKAGQVYGVPLSGSLLCKPGFPEQRSCGEETKKKWIESLSQQHKRLRCLADNIPGYRRKTLFEVLIRNNVPLLRATWFIKVTYLNQVRPSPAAISSGTPDKTHASRCEQWTKDVIEYLQYLLDELLSRNSSFPAQQTRDRSPQMLYTGSVQKISPASASLYGEETSLHFKWWYMVRLLQWHHAEGLLFPNLIVDWVLRLLQEKEVFEILQLLLPIVYGVLESIVLSQTYVQSLVAIAVRFIQEPAPGGSDLVDNSRRAYTLSALIEMVRYLVLAASDTFVASDCFPLPPPVTARGPNDVSYTSKAYENLKSNSADISTQVQGRGVDSRFEFLSFDYTISTIQRSADDLAKIASTGYPQHNVAKAVQALDKALSDGDIRAAYSYLFEDLCNGAVDETWIAEVSPCLRSSLRWIGAISTSFVCSVFFLIEWATCDFRDFRAGVPKDIKFSGRKDCSQVYLVIQLLKQKILGGEFAARRGKNRRSNFLNVSKPSSPMDAFESPGPLHDIIVCWIDQHEVHRGGAKRLQLLVFELIRSGIFNPIAYVRQLIVSGMIDVIQPAVDPERRMRHHRILKQLPGCFVHETLEEAQIFGGDKLSEAVRTYSNERRLLLRELLVKKGKYWNKLILSDQKSKKNSSSLPSVVFRTCNAMADSEGPHKHTKSSVDIRELKERISALLQFPGMSYGVKNPMRDEFQSSVKRSSGSVYSKIYQPEATPGCEDCRRAKRQKMSDEKSSCYQGNSPIASDEEDNWWIKKGLKTLESSLKVDPQIELTKQVPRGRQKMARKTQSLAQLQAARIEGSQGASTSHVCDNKVSCPHHGPGVEGENHKVVDVFRTSTSVDIVSVGKSLKQLQFVDKRSIAVWLTTLVRQLVEEPEKSSVKVGQFNRGTPVEEKSTSRWKLGVDELSTILFLLDISLDFVSVVKFLFWLLPKANSSPSFAVQGGRNLLIMPRNVANNMCEIGEAILVSSLRRYENILLSADLVPEAMTALMNRAASLMSSNGKISGSAALVYARYILKRYGSLPSIVEWHNNFKATCEKRLLSELDHTRSGNGEYGIPLGVPAGVENPDDYIRKKISIGGTRPSRVGLNMRDVVQRHVEEATHYLRKLIGTGTMKASLAEKNDDGFQVAQQIVVGLMDCIRQTGGAAQEGDPTLVSSAVSAIVNSVGLSMARISEFSLGTIHQTHPSGIDSSNFARYILQIHITCLCLLKEALGERQSRVFEIALATESSTALAGAFSPGKGSRGQHQLSPESYDSNANNSTNDLPNGTSKIAASRATKVAAVSALVIGSITHGVITLERIVGLLRLKEYLDFVQFVRRTKSSSNGSARSMGASKVESPIEVYVHWFRLLVGNCKTVSEGLVLELVGESSVVAISRMQRMLPLKLVFPPAYSIIAFILWRPFVLNNISNSSVHEDTHRLYQSLTIAFHDVIKHLPFRDVCLRDTQGLYELIVADSTDADFASVFESIGLDMHLKSVAFAPLRARLFLNSIIDCKVPSSGYSHEGVSEAKNRHQGNGTKLVDKLVSVLDCLQPAKFHWQWVELRLLLNEQALTEKLENHDMPLADAIRSSCPTSEKPEASENEKNFIQILLTRLLVRPDAVPLFSEVVHLFGRSVEESMLKQAEWFLAGQDVLFGRKTIRQKLIIVGESKGLPTKPQFWKPWGWCSSSSSDPITANKADKKRKLEITSIEEGEVIEEGSGSKKVLLPRALDENSPTVSYGITTERAFVQLVLPCIDQSSDESRSTFVNELVRQFSNIEQQLSSVTNRSTTNNKHMGTASSGSEISSNKGSTRKGLRGGSPSLARRSSTNATDTAPPPSPVALRASMSLRLQFLLRLLPVICGEPSFRNTRQALASTIVRLLGSRVVYEDYAVCSPRSDPSKVETDSTLDPSAMADLSSEVLFDRLLFVLHGLLSNHQPNWLKPRPLSSESSKDFTLFDRDAAESLQNELSRMQLPDTIRWRIQAAMPILFSSLRCSLSCQPHSVPPTAVTLVQPSGSGGGGPIQRNSPALPKTGTAAAQGKLKQTMLSPPQQQQEVDNTDVVDPWTLLEDGTSSGLSSSNVSNSSDMANLRATCWLKGAVRVRRTDLTYVGSVDDDS
ncbi:PREDICTED: mediator of RNA polymerase II transcription subunit 12 [Camelina sativa]|uniref:Mediator of RNA polymerase II transcription subunit 12 n=1 Tax=Camelina sativa TaxID=90675 RepID=A0ABM0T1N7_CAMSA|nr:PREDICTED: mediator of RNA polymerase II transcription subunit 12 [Camelina sativa]XP_010419587.1 PREDICTED: mediator of RNA polymerase II transcription subunit 12 [Camelina sativa]